MNRVMRLWPLGLLGLGAAIVVFGFLYDVIFAGIPYQDPTAGMAARYALHARIAAGIRCAGAAFFLMGSVGMAAQLCLWAIRRYIR